MIIKVPTTAAHDNKDIKKHKKKSPHVSKPFPQKSFLLSSDILTLEPMI